MRERFPLPRNGATVKKKKNPFWKRNRLFEPNNHLGCVKKKRNMQTTPCVSPTELRFEFKDTRRATECVFESFNSNTRNLPRNRVQHIGRTSPHTIDMRLTWAVHCRAAAVWGRKSVGRKAKLMEITEKKTLNYVRSKRE